MDMRKSIFPLIVGLFLLLSACAGFPSGKVAHTPIPVAQLLVGGQDRFTATPTPFQPIIQLSNPLTTPTAQPASSPTPDKEKMISLGLERPDGQVNLLLLGSDWRPGQGYRTDVLMILSVIPDQNRVTLLSFPRDLYVTIPGIGYERINAAQAYGGFPLTSETLSYNFDAPVDYYMMTNFAGFRGIVDALGGITIFAAADLYDRCDLPQAYNKMCYIQAGWNTMNGDTALWYVRSRYTTSDFDRTRRAQEVMIAIAQKVMRLNGANRAAELYALFRSSVETDMPLEVVIRLLPIAVNLMENPTAIQRYTISEEQITHYTVPATGAMVLIPNYESIADTIKEALYPSLEQ